MADNKWAFEGKAKKPASEAKAKKEVRPAAGKPMPKTVTPGKAPLVNASEKMKATGKLEASHDYYMASGKTINTLFDKMLEIIQEEKEIGLAELSRRLGMKSGQVEENARILEENGLVEINYPPFGDIKLKAKRNGKGK